MKKPSSELNTNSDGGCIIQIGEDWVIVKDGSEGAIRRLLAFLFGP